MSRAVASVSDLRRIQDEARRQNQGEVVRAWIDRDRGLQAVATLEMADGTTRVRWASGVIEPAPRRSPSCG